MLADEKPLIRGYSPIRPLNSSDTFGIANVSGELMKIEDPKNQWNQVKNFVTRNRWSTLQGHHLSDQLEDILDNWETHPEGALEAAQAILEPLRAREQAFDEAREQIAIQEVSLRNQEQKLSEDYARRSAALQKRERAS